MHYDYPDLRAFTATKPVWYDEHGVPRWCQFGPGVVASIYAEEIALVRIRCANCDEPFDVGMSWSPTDRIVLKREPLSDRIRRGVLSYGDPPNARCCPSGPMTSSESVRVLAFYRQTPEHGWVRLSEYEIALDGEPGPRHIEPPSGVLVSHYHAPQGYLVGVVDVLEPILHLVLATQQGTTLCGRATRTLYSGASDVTPEWVAARDQLRSICAPCEAMRAAREASQ